MLTIGQLTGIKKVLVIDDDPAVSELLKRWALSRRHKIEIESALTSASGEEMFHSERPDVLLLDLNLPGDDGETLLGRLNVADKCATIVGTGVDLKQHERVRLMELGACWVLEKPFYLDELYTCLLRGIFISTNLKRAQKLSVSQESRRKLAEASAHLASNPLAQIKQGEAS